MSLYGALNIGVSGLDAFSTALNVTSSNIANVDTAGYKADSSQFSSMVAASAGAASSANSGVTVETRQNLGAQGLLTTTASPTDLGISGGGLFVVAQNTSATAGQDYTRAGNFKPDSSGNLQNAAGYYLLGWKLDAAGNPPTNPGALTPINISTIPGKAEPTTAMTLQANLQASAATDATYTAGDMNSGVATPDFQRTINVFDSQGGTQPLQLSFIKTAPNTWAYEVNYQGNSANIGGAANNPIATGTLTFNADGSLATPAGGSANVTIPWAAASGLASQTFAMKLGTAGQTNGMTQFDTASVLNSSNVDGAVFGNVTGVSIDKQGIVSANFSNGLVEKMYQIPLATFSNPDGLSALSGNVFQATQDSGTAALNGANTGAAGTVQSGDLESSTVDLANEFTNLITTQRAYTASSRIVTTASAMLDTLMQMQ
jgi:flagellar hook protein FlgE